MFLGPTLCLFRAGFVLGLSGLPGVFSDLKNEDLEERARTLAKPVAQALWCELVDAVLTAEGGRRILRLYIDRPGGVTIDDCVDVSREFSTILDVEDFIPGSYSLEVSSPGLDRPLKREKDFEMFAGKKVKIRTKKAVGGRRNFKGTIKGTEEGSVIVADSGGESWTIGLDNIDKANLVIEL